MFKSVHTCVRAHARLHTRARTHVCVRSWAHMYTGVHANVCMHASVHVHVHVRAHMRGPVCACMYACECVHACACMHMHASMHVHACMHACVRICMCAHKCMRVRVCAHGCTCAYASSALASMEHSVHKSAMSVGTSEETATPHRSIKNVCGGLAAEANDEVCCGCKAG